MRKGIADLHRRAQVSQAANERYLRAIASVGNTVSLGELTARLCQPATRNGRRMRPLNPYAPADAMLLEAISRGELSLNGFRNRDLRPLLAPRYATTPSNHARATSPGAPHRSCRDAAETLRQPLLKPVEMPLTAQRANRCPPARRQITLHRYSGCTPTRRQSASSPSPVCAIVPPPPPRLAPASSPPTDPTPVASFAPAISLSFLLLREGSVLMSSGGQFFMSPDTLGMGLCRGTGYSRPRSHEDQVGSRKPAG
jgi:hypothetical protein